MPNGINTSSRTPTDFYKSQLKFIEKKEDNLNQMYKNIMEDENRNKNVSLASKESVKIASAKNPNESREDFCKRLYKEKLKTVKESIEKPKEEKKLTKEQVNSLSDKLYKEGQTFRNNKDKKQKEKIIKDMKSNREEFASEKTNKVLLDKFISYCNKVYMEVFNRNDNFQISLDGYKLILSNMGCINPNSQLDEGLVKESFNNYLKPNEDKVDIHSFLVFGLAALGIYKGNDEPKKTTADTNPDENRKGFDKNNKNKNDQKVKTKTSSEIIKMYLPDIDLNKYGYTIIGFDNLKYVRMQSKKIKERFKLFDKLYLEVGGKLFDDSHAARILPGFKNDAKISMFLELKDNLEIIFCISASDIEKNKTRGEYGISYSQELLKLINNSKRLGFLVNSVVVTLYNNQICVDNFIKKLRRNGIRTFIHKFVKGYPTNINVIASEQGYGANPYIPISKKLILVNAPGPGSGKLATCLSQVYRENIRNINAGYAKFETFPVWNLPLNHPINLAYEAATADIKDVNLVDPFHLEKYGITATNYNRDIETFPILKNILD